MKLETANSMTLQQLCDYSITRLVEQGSRCMVDTECAYGLNGTHCGIGWMLDEDDADMMEYSGPIDDLISAFPSKIPAPVMDDNAAITVYFQVLHDEQYYEQRIKALDDLQDAGLDTSNPNYRLWADLAPPRPDH